MTKHFKAGIGSGGSRGPRSGYGSGAIVMTRSIKSSFGISPIEAKRGFYRDGDEYVAHQDGVAYQRCSSAKDAIRAVFPRAERERAANLEEMS